MESGTPGTPIKRRLTAILAADAVGYSRQMSENEERTLQTLAAQRAIIDRIIAAHGGRIVGTAGDSVLAEFQSSVEAVRCAVEVQEGLETRNASLPEPERLLFRIGVNLGDVMVDGADILGDGVNVAARLEGIADPGGICISSSVYDQIAGKLNLGFVDIGEKSLKNISRPIRVYRFDRGGELAATPRRAPSHARPLWIGAGAAAVVAIAAVAIWRSGMLERAASPPSPPSTAATAPAATAPTPPAAPLPEVASEETKLKLKIAEAERAKAEADLARSRADAEAAKARARTEHKETASPAAAAAAPASKASPAGAAPSSEPAGAVPVAASPSMAAAAPAASAKVSSPTTQPGSPATLGSARGTAVRFCDAWEELKAFNDVIPARIAEGEIVIERGVPGQPGFLKMTGRPAADGRLSLFGSMLPTVERLKGREILLRFEGTYANGQYSMSGHQGQRNCTMIVRLDTQQ
ncbi:MAG TPA: adenylate/guanylate cyclase domain-containing protein [Casimicrobiaceae bacterium]|nr:adenylate/guanylate cyclase domain-containing protein [Casimicrobiaceae bacterium]